ncbi:MAG: DUF975 family protein [Agathobacter sp.]|nr:DUF975 family protein [Agathobacter sp.]
MWTRVDLKEKAKLALNNNYWKVVLVSLLVGAIVGGTTSVATTNFNFSEDSIIESGEGYEDSLFGGSYYDEDFSQGSGEGYSEQYDSSMNSDEYWEGYYDGYFDNSEAGDTKDYLDGYNDGKLDSKANNPFADIPETGSLKEKFDSFDFTMWMGIAGILIVIVILVVVIGLAIGLTYKSLLINPMLVGINRFFCKSFYEKAEVKEVAYAFDTNYKNVAKIMFLKEIKVILWGLLFIIPGIVKAYEYYLVSYLLAENPNLTKEEAFRLSKQMMDGNKWKTFVLELSFIWWDILSMMTAGIVGIFYVNPYKNLTFAALYEELSAINGHPARAAMVQPNVENTYIPHNYFTQTQQEFDEVEISETNEEITADNESLATEE